SFVVLHDVTQEAHRAFEAAFHLASRSLAALDLIGIYGISSVTAEPPSLDADDEWQIVWLTRRFKWWRRSGKGGGWREWEIYRRPRRPATASRSVRAYLPQANHVNYL